MPTISNRLIYHIHLHKEKRILNKDQWNDLKEIVHTKFLELNETREKAEKYSLLNDPKGNLAYPKCFLSVIDTCIIKYYESLPLPKERKKIILKHNATKVYSSIKYPLCKS